MAQKRLKAQELRAMTAGDLRDQIEKLRQELWHQRVKTTTGASQQHHLRKEARRQIARIETILRAQQASAKG